MSEVLKFTFNGKTDRSQDAFGLTLTGSTDPQRERKVKSTNQGPEKAKLSFQQKKTRNNITRNVSYPVSSDEASW